MSSGSDSDEEFVPGEPEQVSVEESADEETDLQFEKELEHKTKKRKVTATKSTKNKRTRNSCKQSDTDSDADELKPPHVPLNPEQEKKRSDDLWAMFLEGTDSKPKPEAKLEPKTNEQVKPTVDNSKDTLKQNDNKANNEESKDRERRIFEFAGETIVVENNVIKEKLNAAESLAATVSKEDGPSRSRVAGGLSGVLGQLNKKSTLSTLEKSKLDWLTYKKEEGIEDEIQSHNKGKAGYLERKDFLERADVRQYEIERDLRMGRRSNR